MMHRYYYYVLVYVVLSICGHHSLRGVNCGYPQYHAAHLSRTSDLNQLLEHDLRVLQQKINSAQNIDSLLNYSDYMKHFGLDMGQYGTVCSVYDNMLLHYLYYGLSPENKEKLESIQTLFNTKKIEFSLNKLDVLYDVEPENNRQLMDILEETESYLLRIDQGKAITDIQQYIKDLYKKSLARLLTIGIEYGKRELSKTGTIDDLKELEHNIEFFHHKAMHLFNTIYSPLNLAYSALITDINSKIRELITQEHAVVHGDPATQGREVKLKKVYEKLLLVADNISQLEHILNKVDQPARHFLLKKLEQTAPLFPAARNAYIAVIKAKPFGWDDKITKLEELLAQGKYRELKNLVYMMNNFMLDQNSRVAEYVLGNELKSYQEEVAKRDNAVLRTRVQKTGIAAVALSGLAGVGLAAAARPHRHKTDAELRKLPWYQRYVTNIARKVGLYRYKN